METSASAETFVSTFTDFWRRPSPQRLPELLHDDVVLIQPLAPRTAGIAEAQRQFTRFCHCLPDLHARVDRWAGESDLLFIEFTLFARFGRDRLEWPTVNRLILRDGKAVERATYFDPLVVLPTFLRHPSAIWRWLRS